MSRNWTKEQYDAFSSINGTVLVSAAAGSGKTSVLVERVIELLTDKKNAIDADKLLIVTFTNAAANEMKDRINIALSKLIEEYPDNNYLKRQEILLKNANISTIDSYCSKLIRENFYKLGISAKFRMADEKEILIIKREAMDNVLEELYIDSNPKFASLSKVFNYGRDDKRLSDTIEKLYKYTRSAAFPQKWLENKLSMYHNVDKLKDSEWGKVIFKIAIQNVENSLDLINYSLGLCQQDEIIKQNYAQSLYDYQITLSKIKSNIETGNWDEIIDLLQNMKIKQLGRKKCDNIDIKNKIKQNIDIIKSNTTKLKKTFISTEEQSIQDIKELEPIIEGLFDAVKLYTSELDRIKSERKVLDFSDLLHFTLKLLVEPYGDSYRVTEFAKEIQSQFDMIMIDEYQDINEAQDMIFKALSKNESNLFMVGDVKQSIYRFRQSNPKIFINKKDNLQIYNSDNPQYPSKIYLTKNFRSRKGILDFTNFTFSNLLSKKSGDIDYTDAESLHFGADYYSDKDSTDVDIDIISTVKKSNVDKDVIQARHIAKRIKELIATETIQIDGKTRNLQFSDFCILLRSTKKHSQKIKKELLVNGIPAISNVEGTFFGTTEIAVALSLLRIIDNPLQDIPLMSVLLSPIYAFTPDDLAKIRLNSPSKDLYFALETMSKQDDKLGMKCKKILYELSYFRTLAATTCSDKLIDAVLEKTAYFSIVQAMPNGKSRMLNLRMLLDYARQYEKAGFKGLNGFIRFIDRVKEEKSDLSPATSLTQKSNAVRIMSIHKSKGLEFPICIVANMQSKFRQNTEDIDLNENLGVGLYLRDKNIPMIRYSNVPKQAVKLQEKLSGLSEELRVMYVAMTRAKEKLIMVSISDDIRKQISNAAARINNDGTISPYVINSVKSHFEWILMCAIKHKNGTILREIGEVPYLPSIDNNREDIKINMIYDTTVSDNIKTEIDDNETSSDENIINEITKRINFSYSYKKETEIPSKVSASEIAHKDTNLGMFLKPAFLKADKMTATEKGTAMHKFMQYASYENAKRDLLSELKYLYENGFISQKQIKSIDIDKLKIFFNSDLYNRIQKSPKVYRELLFTSFIEASLIDEKWGLEPVVLQGAVDCAFIEDGEAVIVDYKTDKIKNITILKEKYQTQVELYKRALRDTLGVNIKESILYSLYLNEQIKI